MAEWLKAPAWKACIPLKVSRVRIPFSPPARLYEKKNFTRLFKIIFGGEKGIRTLDTFNGIHAFQAGAFNHSAISPSS